MSVAPAPAVLGDLILVRLLAAAKKPPSLGDVRKSLAPLVEHRLSGPEWGRAFDEALNQLRAAGLVEPKRLSLTGAGRAKALIFLGVSSLPPGATWKTLKDKYLIARALGTSLESPEVTNRLKDANGLRALVLKQRYGLTMVAPSLTQAIDALAWKQLGVDSDKPFKAELVLQHLLSLPAGLKSDSLRALIAGQSVQARNSKAEELRLAAIRRWLDHAATAPAAPPPPPGPPPFDLPTFAARVVTAARDAPTGHFGDNKTFIAHVRRQLTAEGRYRDLSDTAFKHHLVEANRAGLLRLSRADLVEAMDPADVRDSETSYLNATFHFVQY
jgi:hypothetical protein